MTLLPAETVGRKYNNADSLDRKPFFADRQTGSKRLRIVSAEVKYDGQSRQEAKISGQEYTLCVCAEANGGCYSTEQQFTLLRNNLVYCEKLFTPLNIVSQLTILNNLLYCETIHSINLLY